MTVISCIVLVAAYFLIGAVTEGLLVRFWNLKAYCSSCGEGSACPCHNGTLVMLCWPGIVAVAACYLPWLGIQKVFKLVAYSHPMQRWQNQIEERTQ